MKILVVDDEPEIVQLVAQFLTLSTHHEAQGAVSSQAALEAISNAETPFDCFLLDIQMPEVNGIELVGMIRETPGYEHAPIIMLTAMRQKHYLDRAFSAGATDYIEKPFDYDDLQRRLKNAQKLCVDKTRQQSRPIPAGAFKGMGFEPKEIQLDDPIRLRDIGCAVDYEEFENYARQLLRGHFGKATAIAVKIVDVDQVYAKSTTEEFKSRVRDAAMVVQQTLLADGGILSYRGSGVFLCIPERRLKPRRGALRCALNKRYQALHPPTDRIASDLQLGDQQKFGGGSDAHLLDCLARAVASVEDQASSSGNIFDLPSRLLRSRRLNDEQKRLEKRAFEHILRDTLTGPEDDAWQRHLSRREAPTDGS